MRDLETEHLTGKDGISITSADGIVWWVGPSMWYFIEYKYYPGTQATHRVAAAVILSPQTYKDTTPCRQVIQSF